MGRKSEDKKPLQLMSLGSAGKNTTATGYAAAHVPKLDTKHPAASIDQSRRLFASRFGSKSQTSSTYFQQLPTEVTTMEGIQAFHNGSSQKMSYPDVKPSTIVLKGDPSLAIVHTADSSLKEVKVEGCTSSSALVNFFSQHSGGESLSNTTNTVYQSCRLAEACGDGCNRSNMRGFGAGLKSTGRISSRAKSIATDRQRRLRIADRLRALQELLPHTVEGGQVSLLDEIIDHVKYLQHQILDLSHTRLGGETALDPLIFLEGRGHFMLHEEMLDEPLGETMEKLFELNSSAAIQLMESRGLYIVPTTLIDDLDQAI